LSSAVENVCDALIHQVSKSLKEHGDKLDAGEKDKIEAAVKEAEEVLKSDDKDRIEAKSKNLAEVAQKLGEKMYADAQAAQGAAASPPPGGDKAKPADDGNVVDAEYTEVSDKK